MRDIWKYTLSGSVVVAGVAVGVLLRVSQADGFELPRPPVQPSVVTESAEGSPVPTSLSASTADNGEVARGYQVRSAMFGVIFTPAGEDYWDQPFYDCRWLATEGEFSVSFGYDEAGAPWASCTEDGENGDLCECVGRILEASPEREDLARGRTEYRMPDTQFTPILELRDQIAKRLPKR